MTDLPADSGIPAAAPANSVRFITLDAMRGVAAIMVVLFHTGLLLGTWVPRFGYLAVDLFFILSGFVLSHAYDSRLSAGMGAIQFLYSRAVRLYPLYVVGLVLGACVTILNADLGHVTLRSIGINFGLNLFGIPAPMIQAFQAPGYRLLFPLNVPFWSLFFEFWVANVLFALLSKVQSQKVYLAVIAACAAGIILSEKTFYTMNAGASWVSIIGGFPRVGFSFFCGVAICQFSRGRQRIWAAPAWFLVILLVVLLSLPLEGRPAHLYELLCVLIIFPLLIYFGAGAIERRPQIGEKLGEASYAIYTAHFPLLVILRWILIRTMVHPNLILQLCFAAALVPPALGLSGIDVRLRKWFLKGSNSVSSQYRRGKAG